MPTRPALLRTCNYTYTQENDNTSLVAGTARLTDALAYRSITYTLIFYVIHCIFTTDMQHMALSRTEDKLISCFDSYNYENYN